jgi:hypothetical protein
MANIAINNIVMDASTQNRPMSRTVVKSYARLMKEGIEFPPVIVFQDDEGVCWLADGFHRVAAAASIDLDYINANLHFGTQRDAILYSLGPANRDHGMPLSTSQKRRRATKLLQDTEWSQWSDRHIAQHCGLSHGTIGTIRKQLSLHSTERKATRQGADGKTYTYSQTIDSQNMARNQFTRKRDVHIASLNRLVDYLSNPASATPEQMVDIATELLLYTIRLNKAVMTVALQSNEDQSNG